MSFAADARGTSQLVQAYTAMAFNPLLSYIPRLTRGLQRQMQHKQLPIVVMLAKAALSPAAAKMLKRDDIASLITLAGAAVPAMSVKQLEQYPTDMVQLSNRDDVNQLLQQTSSTRPAASSSTRSASAASKEAQLAIALCKMPAAVVQVVNGLATVGPEQLQPDTAAAVASILRSMQALGLTGILMPTERDAAKQFYDSLLRLLPALKPKDDGFLVWYATQQQVLGHAEAVSALLGGVESTAAYSAAAYASKPYEEAVCAYCSADAGKQEQQAAAALAALKPAAAGLQLPAERRAASVVLSDMAQALGTSTLQVEPAVMDVLAGHVYSCLGQFTPQQLAVLLWGFARKPPSAAAAEVMRQLVVAAEEAVHAAGLLSIKEQRVVAWAAAKLRDAGLVGAG
jgi:hypothetical protein